jgi:hypothetical protein
MAMHWIDDEQDMPRGPETRRERLEHAAGLLVMTVWVMAFWAAVILWVTE